MTTSICRIGYGGLPIKKKNSFRFETFKHILLINYVALYTDHTQRTEQATRILLHRRRETSPRLLVAALAHHDNSANERHKQNGHKREKPGHRSGTVASTTIVRQVIALVSVVVIGVRVSHGLRGGRFEGDFRHKIQFGSDRQLTTSLMFQSGDTHDSRRSRAVTVKRIAQGNFQDARIPTARLSHGSFVRSQDIQHDIALRQGQTRNTDEKKIIGCKDAKRKVDTQGKRRRKAIAIVIATTRILDLDNETKRKSLVIEIGL